MTNLKWKMENVLSGFLRLHLRLPTTFDQTSDYDHQLDRLYRFGDVHLKAGIESARAVFDAAEGRQRDSGQPAVVRLFPFAQFMDQAETVLAGHGQIADEHIGAAPGCQQLERFSDRSERRH